MPINVIGYPGRALPTAFGVVRSQNPSIYSQQALLSKWGQLPVNLAGCEAFVIPAGQYMVRLGPYTFLQILDPNLQAWMNISQGPGIENVNSDGVNFRLANLTGAVIGAVITNSGSGYSNAVGSTNVPTVTAGGVTLRPIMGQSLNTTITKSNAGANYTQLPILVIDPPPAGGIQATAVCSSLSSGALGTITVTNQGGGYTSIPNVTVINGPGDTTGAGAALTAALISSAGTAGAADTVVGLLPVNSAANIGTAQTSVPSLTITNPSGGGSGLAATAIMCFAALGATTSGMTNAANGSYTVITSNVTAGSATLTNPAISTGLFNPVWGYCANQTAAGALTIIYGGLHQVVPTYNTSVTSNGTISGAITYTGTSVGGINDLSWLQPI